MILLCYKNWVTDEWLVGMLVVWLFSKNGGVLLNSTVVSSYMGAWVSRTWSSVVSVMYGSRKNGDLGRGGAHGTVLLVCFQESAYGILVISAGQCTSPDEI